MATRWILTYIIVCVGILVVPSLQRTIPSNKNSSLDLIEAYLHKYGYLDAGDRQKTNYSEYLSLAISNFQQFAHLPTTGSVDKTTLKKMLVFPRCGVKDIVHRDPDVIDRDSHVIQRDFRSNTFNFQTATRWNKKELTWNISSYYSALDIDVQLDIIQTAFQYWSNVTDLVFRHSPHQEPDIDIRFIREEHGDGHSFDGLGSNAAHAFYPGNLSISGDAHFDEEEEWTLFSNGTNLLAVAVHELGHSLGLGHSSSVGASMSPFFQTLQENFTLHQDDIRGIQSLYGSSSGGAGGSSDGAGTGAGGSSGGAVAGISDGAGDEDVVSSMEFPANVTSPTIASSLTSDPEDPEVSGGVTFDPIQDLNNTNNATSETSKPNKARRKHHRKQQQQQKKKRQKKTEQLNASSDEIDGEIGPGGEENDTITSNTTSNTTTTQSMPRIETGTGKRKLCQMSFDAVVDGFRNKTYAFRHQYIYEIASANITRRKIRALLRKAPINVSSAVFHPVTRELILFKGTQVWKYHGKKLRKGYPKNITDTRYHEPNASVLWYTGLILQFADDMFWFWNSETLAVMDGYPKFINPYWPNLPISVDAAVWYQQTNIYFFKDTQFYKLDTFTRSIHDGYPQELAPTWLNCRKHQRPKRH